MRDETGNVTEYSWFEIAQYGLHASCEHCTDFGSLLDAFYEEKDRTSRLHQRAGDIFKLLSAAQSRLSRKYNILKKELADIVPTPAAQPAPEPKPNAEKAQDDGLITIDDFARVRLRAARVTAAEKVEGADKLLKLTLSLGAGEPERTVVSGIAKFYTPEEMVGKQVVVVANLRPAKLRGIRSEGMILCASDAQDKTLKLVTVEPGVEDGADIR